MRTEMVIRMEASSEKGNTKAMKVAAAIDGVESVTLAGEGRNLLRVVGSGVDSNHLTTRLRRKVGHADIVELRTLHHDYRRGGSAGYTTATTSGRAGSSNGYYYASQLSAGRRGDGGSAAYTTGGGQYGGYSPYYYQQPQPYEGYYPSTPYGTTVVQHEYYPTSNDPNGCSIM